jgi:hypothetical protein
MCDHSLPEQASPLGAFVVGTILAMENTRMGKEKVWG